LKLKKFRNIFPDLKFARFNLAAWQKRDVDSILFIGREVAAAGVTGEPDVGVLKLFEVDAAGAVVQERIIWQPIFDGINLEDPRALELDKENLVIGLTAVLRDKAGRPTPFPAIIKIDSHDSWQHELPPFLIISSFGPGKNVTPIDSSTFLFRPEGAEYDHQLLVFSLHKQVPEKIANIPFPRDLSWAKWRIGTTMPPIWLNEHEALFIIHGISLQVIDGKEKYIYSLGRAKLTRKDNVFSVTVAPDPILVPDDFTNADGSPMVSELHPDIRRVVYSCGGIIKKDQPETLFLYVNVGDRTTFEVGFSLEELKEGFF
jgi:predicted GH43/DUF377 family glycosyl hydrolase